jgi:membrane fusion protein (multidrug efflux system)
MKTLVVEALVLGLSCLLLTGCQETKGEEEHAHEAHEAHHQIVVTSPKAQDVVLTQPYVSQIHSRRHIELRALEEGYLEEVEVKEGQAVKKGDPVFKVLPVLYKAHYDAEKAEAEVARIEYENTKRLSGGNQPVVSKTEVALYEAKLAKALAEVQLAEAELNFAVVKAPYDGIIDRLHHQTGSLVKKDEVLTTLSDNSVMWVYFNVPEARYLEYMASRHDKKAERIELVLADGSTFPQTGTISAIEGQFNNETGNIPFRADFPNPTGLLRHGQTGTVLIRRTLSNAVVIPQRSTFELLDKRYVFVVGEDGVAHQRLIEVSAEQDDTFIIESGLDANDKIVLEGVREVRDGDKLEFEFRNPDEVLVNQKFHAE